MNQQYPPAKSQTTSAQSPDIVQLLFDKDSPLRYRRLPDTNLINPSVDILDYGCGRGDDIHGLTTSGMKACGWGPHYAPDGPKLEADVVNLGFVINVIEDLDERTEALRGAYALAKKVLAVAAMLASQVTQPGNPYRDGFITSRNTFQKYYTQTQLAEFIADVLNEEPVPVCPGVFLSFETKIWSRVFSLVGSAMSRSCSGLNGRSRHVFESHVLTGHS
jgi:DNA phosphorothioation-associated putative methyltransferase